MPQLPSQNLKIEPEKIYGRYLTQSALYDVPCSGQVEAMAVCRHAGMLKTLAFKVGVSSHFQIVGLTVDNKPIPPVPTTARGWVFNVAGVRVMPGGTVIIAAKNISKRRREFCFELTIEVSDADYHG